MLAVAHETQRTASASTFSERYNKGGNEFLNHIARISGNGTRVLFVKVETTEQSKQWMNTHSPNKPEKFKQTLSACQKADGKCFLGQNTSADGGIHATKDHSNVRNVS
jgi:hypothetical protein